MKFTVQRSRLITETHEIRVAGAVTGARMTSLTLDGLDMQDLMMMPDEVKVEWLNHMATRFPPCLE